MQYRRLGRSGLKLSALSYGSWVTFGNQVDERAAVELLRTAYDAGVNFFDNAEVYADGQSERIMGAALRKLGWSRDSYCVSSKAYWGGELPTQLGLSRKHLHDACHAALERLGLDYLDLFFCHRPDPDTPIEETVRAMHDLIAQGKVLYWGTSEWDAEQIQQAHGIARANLLVPPSMEQPEYNMFRRQRVEREYLRLYDEVGLGLTTWSPLAYGILTGKYSRGVPTDSRMALSDYAWLRQRVESEEGRTQLRKTDALEAIAREAGASRAQLAIAWCLKHPRVSTVILGARTVEQLRENLASLDKLPALTAEVMDSVEAVLDNRPEPPRRW